MITTTIDKIIFLDIDGVINPEHYKNALYKMWNKSNGLIKSHDAFGELFFYQNVDYLKHIIDNTHAQIVIHSDWRKNGLSVMRELWAYRNLPGTILDVTPTEDILVNAKLFEFYDEVSRGDCIEFWIKNNNYTGKYVILDDLFDFLPKQKNIVINTDQYYGLTQDDANVAIHILNDTNNNSIN